MGILIVLLKKQRKKVEIGVVDPLRISLKSYCSSLKQLIWITMETSLPGGINDGAKVQFRKD